MTKEIMNNPVVGIIAEYNPFHFGHRYLIDEAKRLTGADTVICAMSGNFVQRGAPAALDKWTRASIAMENGIDAVVEIPVVYCLGSASFYAYGGVRILESLTDVTHLAFGSETGDLEHLQKIADLYCEQKDEINERTRLAAKDGASFPCAQAKVVEEILSVNLEKYTNPNDILGVEYLKNIQHMTPVAIVRQGAGYHDALSTDTCYQSSSAIRKLIRQGQDVRKYVPESGAEVSYHMNEESWLELIRYKILTSSADELEAAPGGDEGLGNRLKAAAIEAESIDQLILAVKSKRHTYTRISRWLYQILLGITREMPYRSPEYIRILGLTERGRKLIRRIQKEEHSSLPIITNVHQQTRNSEMLAMDIRASDIYHLANSMDLYNGSDYRRKPIMI